MRLIFARDDTPLTDLIRRIDGGLWSHVGLDLGDGTVLEARPMGGVSVRPIRHVLAWASASEILETQVPVRAGWDAEIGKPYDWNWATGQPCAAPSGWHCATLLGHVFGIRGPRHPELSLSELRAGLTDA